MNCWEFLYYIGYGVAFLICISILFDEETITRKQEDGTMPQYILESILVSSMISVLSWAIPLFRLLKVMKKENK